MPHVLKWYHNFSAKFQRFICIRCILLLKQFWQNDKLYDLNTYVKM
jgi:hypothetical protein